MEQAGQESGLEAFSDASFAPSVGAVTTILLRSHGGVYYGFPKVVFVDNMAAINREFGVHVT